MKKLFALVLAFCLVLTMLPAPAFAEGEKVCTCDTACTAEKKNTECPVCGAEDASPEKCGKYVTPEPTAAQKVQTLIDALPDAVTAENREAVEVQLIAIDEAKLPLTDEERATLDFTKYDAAIAAINVLDNQPGAEVPQSIPDKKVTVYFYCSVIWPDGDPYGTSSVNDEGIVEFPPDPAATGYEFLGWYTEPDGGGKKVDESTTFTKDTDLYAYMKRTRTTGFTITFDPQGGTLPEGVANTTITDLDGKLTGSLPTPTRDGCEFDGWHAYTYIESMGTYYDIPVSNSSIFGEDMTIYAQWEKIKADFSLSGYGNGLAVSGLKLTSNDDDVTVVSCSISDDKEGTNVLADSHTFTREKVYYVKATFSLAKGIKTVNKFTLNGADCEYTQDSMTVVFPLPTLGYTITLDPNGGTVSSTTVTTNAEGKLSPYPKATRDGYEFDCWYTQPTGGEFINTEHVFTENTTLYAHWLELIPEIGFSMSGYGNGMAVSGLKLTLDKGNKGVASDYSQYGVNYWISLDAYTGAGKPIDSSAKFSGENTYHLWVKVELKEGYDAGWPSNFTLNGNEDEANTMENYVYTVVFQLPTVGYVITLDPNGGTVSSTTVTTDADGKLTALPTPDREDYTFDGWYTAKEGGEKVTADKAYSENTTLYARWKANTYTVHFDANGGTRTMTDQTMTLDQTESLSPNGFTRTGYTFTGWNTQADGKGTGYNNEDEVSNLTTGGGTVTLYAQWKANTYTVHFDANGGEGTMANQTMTCNKSEGLKANAFTLDGHIFRGWNTQPDGTGAFYADGQTVQNLTTEKDAVVTLFAQWELIVDQVNLTLTGHEIDKRVDGVKLTSEEHITFNGAYGSGWGIATNKNTLKTLEGKLFRADTQYYLWVIFSPEEGCTLEGLTAKDVTLDGTAALSLEDMQGSRMALFRLPVIYTITVTAGKNGSVSSDSTINAKGVITVFEGEDVTIKITPDKDYVVYRLTVDGTSVKTARTYTFENIQQSHTLRARFLKNGTNAKTGDSFPLVPAIAVLTLSAAALVAVVVIAKKKKKK